MYDRLLLPVDGSDEATQAARRGLELARRFDGTVDALHVVPQKALRLTRSTAETEALRERGRTALSEIEDESAAFGHPLNTTLREGSPAAEISAFAAEQDADLIVIGRQGATGLRKKLLGGVTEQVLHRGETPVFVVPSDVQPVATRADYSRLLIPTDGSDNAEAATPHGVALADGYDSELHVLNVIDLQSAGGMFSAGGLNSEFIERLEADGQEAVDRVADEITAADDRLDVETAVERTASFDGVAAGIRAYIADANIDLIVMGSHGRSNLNRQLLGSIVTTVLRTVDVPVVVVKRTSQTAFD